MLYLHYDRGFPPVVNLLHEASDDGDPWNLLFSVDLNLNLFRI